MILALLDFVLVDYLLRIGHLGVFLNCQPLRPAR